MPFCSSLSSCVFPLCHFSFLHIIYGHVWLDFLVFWIGWVVNDFWLELHVSSIFKNTLTWKIGDMFNTYFSHCVYVREKDSSPPPGGCRKLWAIILWKSKIESKALHCCVSISDPLVTFVSVKIWRYTIESSNGYFRWLSGKRIKHLRYCRHQIRIYWNEYVSWFG